jgi:2,3-bisphosphoglycerate-dependent phosphoglycerate mutase
MAYLILLRHGQSVWNEKNIFTGWVDVPLSAHGIEQALQAGDQIKNYPIDVIFSSQLIRAKMTATIAMLSHSSQKVPVLMTPSDDRSQSWAQIFSEETKKETIPMICAWQLNERMYGELQGLNKAVTAEKFGKEQVQKWRRSYNERPPEGESLKMTVDRAWPYFQKVILPYLKDGKNVFVSAHGNSLRAIMMHLDHLTEEEVATLELDTGRPYIYRYQMTLNKYEKIS